MIVWSFGKTTIQDNFIFLILSPLIINNKKAPRSELFYFRHSHHPTRRKNGWFSNKATPLISVIFNTSPLESVSLFYGAALCGIWQDRAVSSLLGSSPRIGGAIPPPATMVAFLLGGKVMLEAICLGITGCLYDALELGLAALILTSFLKECRNIWKNK